MKKKHLSFTLGTFILLLLLTLFFTKNVFSIDSNDENKKITNNEFIQENLIKKSTILSTKENQEIKQELSLLNASSNGLKTFAIIFFSVSLVIVVTSSIFLFFSLKEKKIIQTKWLEFENNDYFISIVHSELNYEDQYFLEDEYEVYSWEENYDDTYNYDYAYKNESHLQKWYLDFQYKFKQYFSEENKLHKKEDKQLNKEWKKYAKDLKTYEKDLKTYEKDVKKQALKTKPKKTKASTKNIFSNDWTSEDYYEEDAYYSYNNDEFNYYDVNPEYYFNSNDDIFEKKQKTSKPKIAKVKTEKPKVKSKEEQKTIKIVKEETEEKTNTFKKTSQTNNNFIEDEEEFDEEEIQFEFLEIYNKKIFNTVGNEIKLEVVDEDDIYI